MTKEFAIEYIQEECEDCPQYKDGECISNSHCFEVKRMAIQAIRQMYAIDDIRAEIDEHIQDCQLPQGHDPWWNGRKDGLNDALEIINDRIGKE